MKKQLDPQIEVLKKETEEWKTKYMRVLADYQNLDKRAQDQVGEARKFAAEMILQRILPVLDTFTKVKNHIKDMGFDLAYKELLAVIEEQGVTPIKVLGEQFDPHQMECIEVVSGKDNEVVEELLVGYMFRGKVLRIAQVKVGKSSGADTSSERSN
ncbi:nucleotide exchange factor GrpE [Candidatus Woesebacteria bacterium]|jgi:molecular chaperone GrpE|nr:nucleotide exchange factor GrpE [Candidatus Woesebacteria bacterium]